MAKLTFLFVFGMVLHVSLGSTANPLMNPVNSLMAGVMALGNPATWDIAVQCPGLCNGVCSAQAPFCVNIPNVMDCGQMHTACTTACDGLCGCYSSCKSDCLTNYPCGSDDLIQETACTAQRLVCTSVCNTNCPIQQQVKSVSQTVAMLGMVISSFMGAGGVAPPPTQ